MSNPFPILKDPKANKQLAEQGYTILPYLDQKEVQELKTQLATLVPELPDRFYASVQSEDLDLRKNVSRKIVNALEGANEKSLDQGKALGATYISKPASQNGALPWHQDWTIVDEKQFRSFNIWIPLVDVNEKNGAVTVLPGSHLRFENIRGPGVPAIFEPSEALMKNRGQLLSMKAGEALIYNHALWHKSSINTSEEARPGIIMGMIPQLASLLLFQKKNDYLLRLASSEAFFMEHELENAGKVLPLLDETIYDFSPLSEKEFLEKITPKKRFFWLPKFLQTS